MSAAHAIKHSGAVRAKDSGCACDRWAGLMVAAQSGHGAAYDRLLTEVVEWLRRFYSRRLPHAMVDDAVQETLIALHAKRHTYEAGRPFRPWLAGIARYKWIDRLREMARDRFDPIDDYEPTIPDHGSAITSRIIVDDLLAHLKPDQARAIRLVKLDGLSIEETAAATGQSASLVKVNIHRGIAKLSRLLGTSDVPPRRWTETCPPAIEEDGQRVVEHWSSGFAG